MADVDGKLLKKFDVNHELAFDNEAMMYLFQHAASMWNKLKGISDQEAMTLMSIYTIRMVQTGFVMGRETKSGLIRLSPTFSVDNPVE